MVSRLPSRVPRMLTTAMPPYSATSAARIPEGVRERGPQARQRVHEESRDGGALLDRAREQHQRSGDAAHHGPECR